MGDVRIGGRPGRLPRVELQQTLGGRYKLLSELGSGGMAVVWRARDEVLGRPVAVKVLAGRFAGDPHSRARIRDEARAAATLSHPNIAQVYDYGESTEGGTPLPYVVMELVNGPTLQQRVARSPLPPRTVFRICGEVAAALAAAHADGLVHRDIKMANIMVTASGAKVVDFGIAAAIGPASPEDMVVGTPAYLAPERLMGAAVEPASDVYALGVLLYRLLAHHAPWSVETTTQMLNAHIYIEPEPLPQLPGVPPAIIELVARCLRKTPGARPSATEVSAMLGDAAEAAILQTPDPVRPPSAPSHPRIPRPADGDFDELTPAPARRGPGPARARSGFEAAAGAGRAASLGPAGSAQAGSLGSAVFDQAESLDAGRAGAPGPGRGASAASAPAWAAPAADAAASPGPAAGSGSGLGGSGSASSGLGGSGPAGSGLGGSGSGGSGSGGSDLAGSGSGLAGSGSGLAGSGSGLAGSGSGLAESGSGPAGSGSGVGGAGSRRAAKARRGAAGGSEAGPEAGAGNGLEAGAGPPANAAHQAGAGRIGNAAPAAGGLGRDESRSATEAKHDESVRAAEAGHGKRRGRRDRNRLDGGAEPGASEPRAAKDRGESRHEPGPNASSHAASAGPNASSHAASAGLSASSHAASAGPSAHNFAAEAGLSVGSHAAGAEPSAGSHAAGAELGAGRRLDGVGLGEGGDGLGARAGGVGGTRLAPLVGDGGDEGSGSRGKSAVGAGRGGAVGDGSAPVRHGKRKALLAGGGVAAALIVVLVLWGFAGGGGKEDAVQGAVESVESVAPTPGSVSDAPSATGDRPGGVPAATEIGGQPPTAGSGPSTSAGSSAAASAGPVGQTPQPSSSVSAPASTAPEGTRLTSAGGVVYALCAEGKATFTWWEPAEGYAVQKVKSGPALTAEIVFRGASARYRMTVTCVAGIPTPVVLPL